MEATSRPRMDYAAEQARRLRAAPLFAAEESQAEVARRLGVSRQTASRWYWAWRREGKVGLRGTDRTGRHRKLSPEQLRELEQALVQGPRAWGYGTELWTLKRMARVIRKQFRVSYHPSHVWRLLGQLGWSCQRPERQARERNERAIRHWLKQEWPRIKKRPVGSVPC